MPEQSVASLEEREVLFRTLEAPETDIADLNDHFSQAWGVRSGASAAQYLAWCESTGLIASLVKSGPALPRELADASGLSDDGIDALLPILVTFGLAQSCGGRYTLTKLAKEYFLKESPYYVGTGLFWGCDRSLPPPYSNSKEAPDSNRFAPTKPWDPELRLRIQHSRNFGPCVIAARSMAFENIHHLVDIGGGSGTIAIPFALDHPAARITLVDLPGEAETVRPILRSYGVEHQFELISIDVFRDEWAFPAGDAMVFGNFFHMFNDERCRFLARKCVESLQRPGKIILHEVLFDEGKTGPKIAALWNANMHVIGGRQRTLSELTAMLAEVGLCDFHVNRTAGRFSLLEAHYR